MQIEVEAVDRTGTFIGSLWESKTNMGSVLLEAGLAKLSSFGLDRISDAYVLTRAEQSAKQQKLKVIFYFFSCGIKKGKPVLTLHFSRYGRTMLRVKRLPMDPHLNLNKRRFSRFVFHEIIIETHCTFIPGKSNFLTLLGCCHGSSWWWQVLCSDSG